jgi:hypothetical protein
MNEHRRICAAFWRLAPRTVLLVGLFALQAVAAQAQVSIENPAPCSNANRVSANVVAIDQVYTYNRFGAFNPAGMIYALRRDVVALTGSGEPSPGNAQLRPDKRPRPLVLRVHEGSCLRVTFTNLLAPNRVNNNQPITRTASIHVNGLEYVGSIASDGANVGQNPSSLVAPGQTITYEWYARKQGTYLIYSTGAQSGGQGDGGQLVQGLFGSINVEPRGTKWYRSQVTSAVLDAATIGTNPDGTPRIDYNASDANGRPLLKILDSTNQIAFSDLDAIITDDDGLLDDVEDCNNAANSPTGKAPPSGTCGQPFREFTTIFHDEIQAVQAFPVLEEKELFHGVRDGFAVNYGASGMGSILLANRARIGPSKNCQECKFEDFFLTSWVNGDPALLLKASTPNQKVAAFPDDPSNVHHSYLGEPVRFRNIHAGPKETHVFHLHAHQWLHEPRVDGSTYLDSQTISPGSAFTYEINFGGSGNRIFTPGDAIFHCHLYPHFAQGMWELWRNHDVFENGKPNRNLPDGEVAQGIPTPAIVPIPNVWLRDTNRNPVVKLGMPPMPTPNFPGYPFYIGVKSTDNLNTIAGHRPPQPPLDFAVHTNGQAIDGGLPRHRVLEALVDDGRAAIQAHAPGFLNDPVAARVLNQNNDPDLTNFARFIEDMRADQIPHLGTDRERTAMDFHAGRFAGAQPFVTQYEWPAKAYPAFTAEGQAARFLVNGQPETTGAPYAEPCKPGVFNRNYRAVNIQFDMVVNRAGWHDRQARISLLELDLNTNTGRPIGDPEPLYFRANSQDCITFQSTNLVLNNLNLDDFQIFTPTDTLGNHIHLVKFDVTSSDGAANGWNYEDGTFSPGEVQERIRAIRHRNGCTGRDQGDPRDGTFTCPVARPHPRIGLGPAQDLDGNGLPDWLGAQTTVQRWWADPLKKSDGKDYTLQTVFTHDHFGPSSHQHHGLYGALVIEPDKSNWRKTDGTLMGGENLVVRADGGPTSFKGNIETEVVADSFREFNIAFADFAIVYTPNLEPVNPPGRKEVGLPHIVEPPDIPQPEAISADDPGTQLINYRNEPIPLRIRNPQGGAQFPVTDPRGNMANVFSSTVHGDPFTPLFEAYEGDKVTVRLIQGAQEEQHVFSQHAGRWLFENFAPNSGFRNAQAIGISEHFEFHLPPIPAVGNPAVSSDFLYGSFATDNLWDGMWGIMRGYRGVRSGLRTLPSNPAAQINVDPILRGNFCPPGPPPTPINVEAWLARDLVGPRGIVYNSRFQLHDPAGIVFVLAEDVDKIQVGQKKLEPLVLRAKAGDCIEVRLTNRLPNELPDYAGWNFMPMLIPRFNLNQIRASNEVGLHPQLMEYNVRTSDGANIGQNPRQTVAPNQSITYRWYAGRVEFTGTGGITATPVEYGTINLTDYGDIMKHGMHGAIGTIIIEPQGATWTLPQNSNAQADVTVGNHTFREFVINYQDDLNMLGPTNESMTQFLPVRNLIGEEDAEDSGMKAFNYRTEPIWARLGFRFQMVGTNSVGGHPVVDALNDVDQTNVLSSKSALGCIAGCLTDPETPGYVATPGQKVRFRVNQPTGHPRQHGWTIHGHNWLHEPYVANSHRIWRPGFDIEPRSMMIGTQGGHTARRHWDVVLRSAGGIAGVVGDYLYRTQESFQFTNGLWGIFRVRDPGDIRNVGPTNLQALAISGGITLSWTDNNSNETGFRIERKVGLAGSYAQVGVALNTLHFDSGLTPGTFYCYRVRAHNSIVSNVYSNESCAKAQ